MNAIRLIIAVVVGVVATALLLVGYVIGKELLRQYPQIALPFMFFVFAACVTVVVYTEIRDRSW